MTSPVALVGNASVPYLYATPNSTSRPPRHWKEDTDLIMLEKRHMWLDRYDTKCTSPILNLTYPCLLSHVFVELAQ